MSLTSETSELNDTGQNLKLESVRNPEHKDKASPKRHRCAECGKQYLRAQELKRHKRDKHEQLRKCPFCRAEWSRTEKIRAHIITDHRDRFNEKEHQEIRRLRGWTDTIQFLTKCESIMSQEVT
jgi:CRISPR/Cas system-associated protein Cas10 (large subunit of type III CRISPR-Cas system)